jgi:hypothetical protein
MSSASKERAQLDTLLNTPGLTSLPVRVVIAGEVQVVAQGPLPVDRLPVVLEPGKNYNLLDFAPQSWWRGSPSLYSAVDNRWIEVIDSTSGGISPTPIVTPTVQYIPMPSGAQEGDLLVYDGSQWVAFSPGVAGTVLTSNGPGTEPTFQPLPPSPGTGSVLTGQATAGLSSGNVVYVNAANTWLKAINNGTYEQATAGGVYLGVPGEIWLSGSPIPAALFTTSGGSPANGQEVYLAASTDDGGTGAGKLTATPPVSGLVTIAGICVDNSNYAGSKTCSIVFMPRSAIQL